MSSRRVPERDPRRSAGRISCGPSPPRPPLRRRERPAARGGAPTPKTCPTHPTAETDAPSETCERDHARKKTLRATLERDALSVNGRESVCVVVGRVPPLSCYGACAPASNSVAWVCTCRPSRPPTSLARRCGELAERLLRRASHVTAALGSPSLVPPPQHSCRKTARGWARTPAGRSGTHSRARVRRFFGCAVRGPGVGSRAARRAPQEACH